MTVSPDTPQLQRWKWLRFVPLNFATTLPFLGFFIGREINDPFGTGIGVIIGLFIGVPLQLVKGFSQGDDQGCDLDQAKNKLQLQVGVGFFLVGVVAAWFVAPDHLAPQNGPAWVPLIVLSVGGVAAFALGVFLSGAYLAILDSMSTLRNWIIGLRR